MATYTITYGSNGIRVGTLHWAITSANTDTPVGQGIH